jgi:hypothetical protein
VDKEDRRLRIVAHPDITDLSPPGLIISNIRLNMSRMEPIGQVFVIHPELNKPVKNEKKDDKEDQQSKHYSDKDPADF